MKYRSIILAAILVLFSGCADRSASDFASASSPAFAGNAECERNLSVWRRPDLVPFPEM